MCALYLQEDWTDCERNLSTDENSIKNAIMSQAHALYGCIIPQKDKCPLKGTSDRHGESAALNAQFKANCRSITICEITEDRDRSYKGLFGQDYTKRLQKQKL